MSFSLDVKMDLLQADNNTDREDKLELEAMLRLGGEVIISRPMKLLFTASNMGIIRFFITTVKKYYQIETEIFSRKIDRFDSHTVFCCEIIDGAQEIINDLNLIGSESKYRASDLTDEEMSAYLRGAFIIKGSVNDPNSKSSHLEISSTAEHEILYLQRLMNTFELNARISKRKSYLLVYLKSISAIADFLYRIKASQTMTYYEDVIITKEISATSKRTINLDLANQDKTNDAAREQLRYIQYLKYNYPLQELDSKILMVMKVREENPEHSLSQLLEIIHDEYDPKLTKSGLNHRFRKIKELALSLKELKNDD